MGPRRTSKSRQTPRKSRETQKVYVETSVWGMALGNQPRALREPTQQFLRQCALGLFLPHISTVVVEEVAEAPEGAAVQMLREINKLMPVRLDPTEKSEELADAYLSAGVIPAKKRDDARHVAIATVAGLEIVVSWNHRHLANERKRALFNAVNQLAGYDQVLLIHTPFEVMQ
jgi:hypothetical protein